MYKINTYRMSGLLSMVLVLLLSACGGSNSASPTGSSLEGPTGTPIDPIVPAAAVTNGEFQIALSGSQFNLTEGGGSATATLTAVRLNGHNAPINLAVRGTTTADEADSTVSFSDIRLEGAETTSNLTFAVGIARGPILPQTRQFELVATDGSGSSLQVPITVNLTPTSAVDVYLQIGQSNMVGSSLFGARESDPGEADAPDSRILQLNVTGNDTTNFPSPAAFSNSANVANPDALMTVALDPLHDGFNFSIGGKTSTKIGMGLSFARAMLLNTTTNVVLVPAAWSDSGFCQTDTIPYPATGWLATPPTDTVNFAGTLLHDRALTRLNLTLQETQGIFRGIIWHQGEADSNDEVCAAAYETNLRDLVASIRSNAQVDARGSQARGATADIPFVAGTMSQGEEFSQLSPIRAQVDAVHRLISSIIPFASTVINDDLVPPAYPCGDGSCIHFGATAYREMGSRYANRMLEIQRR